MGFRTTLTLEDDVAARLKTEARRTGKSFKTLVNEALRAGLDSGSRSPRKRFAVKARDLGLHPGIDLDDIGGLIERVEGVRHR